MYICSMATGKNISIPVEEYQQLVQQKQELEQIRFELSELKRMLFGRKSERYLFRMVSYEYGMESLKDILCLKPYFRIILV